MGDNLKSDVKNFLEYKFEKIKLLQKTNKSEIFLAEVRETKKLVVIKFLKSVGFPYSKLKKISHPLWAKILYCAEDSADTVVVEEFLQGESLSERLEQKKFLSETEARKILLQLCDGLKVLHENKIVHRDIKPSNLILQSGGIIRLIDFDAARIFDSSKNKDTHFLGTKGYAPPEQFGYGQTDSRSDIFSLGVTIFEMLDNNCSSRMRKILSKCTELDPKNRYQNTDELKAAILEKPRTFNKKIFVCSVFVGAGILFFANSTTDKNIPVEVDKNSEVIQEEIITPPETEQPAQKKSVTEKFKFPEIKFPQQNNSPPPTTNQNIELPQMNFPEIKIPKPAEKNSEPEEVAPLKNYVKVKYWLNNERSAGWTDNFDTDITNTLHAVYINEANWSKWQSGDTVIIPDGNYIYVEAQNFSSAIFTNPQINLVYKDEGITETKIFYGASSIAPGGGKISFSIPIGGYRVRNPRRAGDNWQSFEIFHLYFSGSGAEIVGSEMQYDFGFISYKGWADNN